ncbi:MAG TPA: hypothetical protein PLT09_03910 [Deltaproteobacteria bacterium]|nr:hypothetical protein [Deltaproteobacteria bacterium]HPR54816.1 hypothetical protein [Deltaproteobacteria bacterium]HXK46559.1 hypothetical protein [Deltaproteobacteria bacterium]
MADTGRASLLSSLREVTQDHVRTGKPLGIHLSIPGRGEVVCTEVFRAIRGKRLVCLGSIGVAKVVVKLYFANRRARRHWRRSDRGCRAFLDRGIPAPEILFSGHLPEYGIYAMILEFLEGGVRIDRALSAAADEREQRALMDRLTAELALHHASGLLQEDLHLGNFMLRDDTIYSLDGDRVACCRRPPGRRRSLENLVLLLANLPVWRDADLDACIHSYVHARHWGISDSERTEVRAMVGRKRRKDLSGYLAKALSSRDPFVVESEPGLFAVLDKRNTGITLPEIREAAWRNFPGHVDPSAGYDELSVGDHKFWILSTHGLGALFFKPWFGAVRAWKQALALNRIGLHTPQPVALVLRRRAALLWRCSVLFRPVEGRGLREFFLSPHTTRKEKESCARDLAGALARMQAVGITPGEVNPEGILVSGTTLVFAGRAVFRRPLIRVHGRGAKALDSILALCSDIPELGDLIRGETRLDGGVRRS